MGSGFKGLPAFEPVNDQKKDNYAMILSQIKTYLSEKKTIALGELCIHFDTEPDAMRGMLEHWIRKSKVKKHAIEESCNNGCLECSNHDAMEIYEWVE